MLRLVLFLAVGCGAHGQSLNYGSGTTLPAACKADADLFYKTDGPAGQHYYGCVLNSSNVAAWTLLAPVVVPPPPAGQWSVGYWNSVGIPSCPVADIDMAALSHVTHWAALVHADGTLDLTYNALSTDAANLIKAAHAANVKVIFSVVNPYWLGQSGNMPAAVTNHLTEFVNNIMTVVNQYGYDGVDIDWEGSPPNMAQLGPTLRAKLGTAKLLTADALITDYQYWGTVHNSFDRVNVMTYDMTGTWDPYSWHNSALYGPSGDPVWSIDLARRRFVAGGVPISKMNIGIPFYGLQWSGGGVTAPQQHWTTTPTIAQVNYNVIQGLIPSRTQGWDTLAHVPYLSGGAGPGFLTYDNAQSVTDKVNYAKSQKMGGWIIWNLSEDYFPTAVVKHPLLTAVRLAR